VEVVDQTPVTVLIAALVVTVALVLQGKAIQEAQELDLMQTLKTRTMAVAVVAQLAVVEAHLTVVKTIEDHLEVIW
jgi:hypothetical protein